MKVKNYLPGWLYNPSIKIYNKYFNKFYQKSYAQEGEDIIFRRIIFGKIEKGFYVDVGAHHPKRFSNTYLLYTMGWRGINIEPMPGSKKIFDKYRSQDINLEIPISAQGKELTYFIFNEPALNGFSKEMSIARDGEAEYRILKTVNMRTKTLCDALDEYLPPGKKINLLNVDVEGLDLDVLKSNNWNKYVPDYLMVEDKEFNLMSPDGSAVHKFMLGLNYQLIVKTLNTLIYKFKL